MNVGAPPPDELNASATGWGRGALALLLAAEALVAAAFIGFGISWVAGASAYFLDFNQPPASERLITSLDVPLFLAYVLPLAITLTALAAAGFSIWRTRRSPEQRIRWPNWLADALVLGQPFLLTLIAAGWLLIAYGAGPGDIDGYSGGHRPLAVTMVLLAGAVGLAVAIAGLVRSPRPRLWKLLVPLALVVALGAASLFSASRTVRTPGFSSAAFAQTGVVQWASVSCPAPARCIAFGASWLFQPPGELASVAVTTDGGNQWRDLGFPTSQLRQETGSPGAPVIAVPLTTCPTVERCYVARAGYPSLATGTPLARTDDGGKTWTILPAPLGANPKFFGLSGGLACMTSSRCVLVDARDAIMTTDSGSSWRILATMPAITSGPPEMSGVSCPSAARCVVYFSRATQGQPQASATTWTYRTELLTTSNGGRSWSSRHLPGSLSLVTALWCGDAGECLTSGTVEGAEPNLNRYQLSSSTDWGTGWSVLTRTVSVNGGLTCVSATKCFALGSLGRATGLLTTDDGGRAWSVLLAGSFSSFSCSGPLFCSVSGPQFDSVADPRAFFETTTDGGATWHRAMFPIVAI
jgi:hypothetical protein